MTDADPDQPLPPVLIAVVAVALIGTATWLLVDYRAGADDRAAIAAAPVPEVTEPSATTSPSAVDGFQSAGGSSPGTGRGRVHTYTVEVEQGTDVAPGVFAEEVDGIIGDVRGWTVQRRSFQRLPEQGSITISLAATATADRLCADPAADGPSTCFVEARLVIGVADWEQAPAEWPDSQGDYRTFLVNHGLGHALAAPDAGCPGEGATAPVMVRQPAALEGCVANPWPFPTVIDAEPAGAPAG